MPFVPGAQAQARAARIERITIRPALRRAAALLCISEATRVDLVARFPGRLARATSSRWRPTRASRGARRSEEVEARLGLDRPYVLAVGTLEPRKNLERAHRRLARGCRTTHDARARRARAAGTTSAIVAAARAPRDVRLLGRVSDDDLAALYAGAACFAYPSLYEGFGLPVLEAMAAGAPVADVERVVAARGRRRRRAADRPARRERDPRGPRAPA